MTDWKNKFQGLMDVCQSELKRTADIGKKMLSASQSNSKMTESYEDLGRLLYKAIKNSDLSWENDKVTKLINSIDELKSELEQIENEVQEIKKDQPQNL
ncbi:MAG: hypothetical protein N4A33_01590 [Bacteriovoracaceae bacterium]|jgi:hypothetical protein|nr:hypothetical protein [Bacteriovoracaceae bacterium]